MKSGLASVLTSATVARRPLRRQVLHRRAGQQSVLPFDMPGAYSQGEELPLLCHGRCGCGGGLPPLSSMPARSFAGHSGVAGNLNTVSRALRLIGESGLEDGGVEVLAERFGVGSRHLRRLFLQHLGATPSAVAHTRRLHFAKKLIDETSLPMSHVAQASGFGCVRRFNAAISKTYHRTPTQIRRLAHQKKTLPGNQYLFRLRYRPPYQWENMLAFLAARATPGVEEVRWAVTAARFL